MKRLELQHRLNEVEALTQSAMFSYKQARVMFAEESEHSMYTALCRHTKSGVIHRVCKGVWINPFSRYANSDTRLEELTRLLRPNCFNYVSLETVLSQASVISQQMFGYLTVMTTGTSKTVKTPFGTLELTHTKRPATDIFRHQIPEGRRIPWADVKTAYRDLKRVGRNVHMVDEDELLELNYD